MNKEQFLAMSLPYGLKMQYNRGKNDICDFFGMEINEDLFHCNHDEYSWYSIGLFNPVLHPISDLTKEIEHKGEVFIPIERILQKSCFDTSKMTKEEIDSYADVILMPELMSLNDALLLAEWHFDIAGLIEKGEAIDVNTLPENPYK